MRSGSSRHLFRDVNAVDVVETADLFSEKREWWTEVCRDVDTVVHAAWFVEPGLYLDSQENAACLSGSFVMAQGAADAGVGHFIGIGTCMEYRLPSDRLTVESPLLPSNFYSACKLSLYHMLKQWFAQRETMFSWCRLFYLYGEGEDQRRLVPYLKRQLEAGEVAHLSSGAQLRDFLDVYEAGAMIANVVKTRQPGAINICSGEAITIRAFVERIADTYGRRDLLEFGTAKLHASDPAAVVGVCNLARTGASGDVQ